MFPFSQSVTPAAKTHIEAQVSFLNDMSKSMFRVVQQYSDLNIQLAQTLIEEGTVTSQELLTTQRPTEMLTVTMSHAQPAADKLRAYQQHLSRIAANTQVDLAKVAEEHVTETSRTAKALAEEVARVASEETEKNMRNQQEAMRRMASSFDQFSDGKRSGDGMNGHVERQDDQQRAASVNVQQAAAASASRQQQPGGGRKES